MEHLKPVDNLVDTIAAIFQSSSVFTIKEVGIFPSPNPDPSERILSNAIQQTSSRFGLASWALNVLYVSAKQRIVEDRSDISAATAILIGSPDFLTAWNVRKAVFKRQDAEKELHFTALVLTRNPKSAETWTHRHWVFRTLGFEKISIDTELQLAWMAATRVPCNYYATVHRLRLLPFLTDAELIGELEKSRKWLQTHVSDCSGWAYHRMLVQSLFQKELIQHTEEGAWFQRMTECYASTHQNTSVHSRWFEAMTSASSTTSEHT